MKMDGNTAAEILCSVNATVDTDFHTLTSAQVERITAAADRHNYRKPRGANGSRARYFFAYCQRAARRE